MVGDGGDTEGVEVAATAVGPGQLSHRAPGSRRLLPGRLRIAQQSTDLTGQAGGVPGFEVRYRVARKMLLDRGQPRADEGDVHEDELEHLVGQHQVAVAVWKKRHQPERRPADFPDRLRPRNESVGKADMLLQPKLVGERDQCGAVLAPAQDAQRQIGPVTDQFCNRSNRHLTSVPLDQGRRQNQDGPVRLDPGRKIADRERIRHHADPRRVDAATRENATQPVADRDDAVGPARGGPLQRVDQAQTAITRTQRQPGGGHLRHQLVHEEDDRHPAESWHQRREHQQVGDVVDLNDVVASPQRQPAHDEQRPGKEREVLQRIPDGRRPALPHREAVDAQTRPARQPPPDAEARRGTDQVHLHAVGEQLVEVAAHGWMSPERRLGVVRGEGVLADHQHPLPSWGRAVAIRFPPPLGEGRVGAHC